MIDNITISIVHAIQKKPRLSASRYKRGFRKYAFKRCAMRHSIPSSSYDEADTPDYASNSSTNTHGHSHGQIRSS